MPLLEFVVCHFSKMITILCSFSSYMNDLDVGGETNWEIVLQRSRKGQEHLQNRLSQRTPAISPQKPPFGALLKRKVDESSSKAELAETASAWVRAFKVLLSFRGFSFPLFFFHDCFCERNILMEERDIFSKSTLKFCLKFTAFMELIEI